MRTIKLFEMFAGYGGASFALKKAKIPFEVVGYSEIDKWAIKVYEQNHSDVLKGKNHGDARTINPYEIPDFDLLTAGFPCQPFSNAGKRLGTADNRGTLFDEIIRIAEVKKPRWMLLENVKGLLSKRFEKFYYHTLKELERIGYKVFQVYNPKKKRYEIPVLNSKNYGIPQNRERVWYFCFREQKDFELFELPEREELKLFLKDLLEEEVDEKYYVNNKVLARLEFPVYDRKTGKALDNVSSCLRSGAGSGNQKIIRVNNPKHSNDRVYSPEGISPTLNTMQGGHRQPFIIASRGRYDPNGTITQKLEPKFDGTTNSITTVQKDNWVCVKNNNQRGVIINDFRIRKLTPKECFRLMGFLNDEINLDGLSDTQKYKLAGNGWDVNLVSKIFKKLFSKVL